MAWKVGCLVVLAGVWLMSLTGCDFRRVVVNDPLLPESIDRLVPGTSTMADVVQQLGAPDEVEEGAGGMIFRYRYGDSKTMRVNFGWLFRLVLPVVPPMNLGRGDGMTSTLYVAMNPDLTFSQAVVEGTPRTAHFWFWPF